MYAWHGMNVKEFYWCIEKTLEFRPTLTLDDGADLIMTVHTKRTDAIEGVIGGTEETTTGVHRLRAMGKAGQLKYPVIAVNDAETKSDFDNVYGTGQSSLDGILRATSVMLPGKTFVVAGYGKCGKGVATKARGMGANVVVTEIKPTMALKAHLDGFTVMKMDDAAKVGDIFITATGMKDVIVERHFARMKEGAIVCNTGHYDCEINIPDLEQMAQSHREIRPNNDEYRMKDGRRIYLLARGRLVNLAAAEWPPVRGHGHELRQPALALIRLHRDGPTLSKHVHDLPKEQDREIATLALHDGHPDRVLTPSRSPTRRTTPQVRRERSSFFVLRRSGRSPPATGCPRPVALRGDDVLLGRLQRVFGAQRPLPLLAHQAEHLALGGQAGVEQGLHVPVGVAGGARDACVGRALVAGHEGFVQTVPQGLEQSVAIHHHPARLLSPLPCGDHPCSYK